MLDKVTIVIPTKNRHTYLERIIDYYSNSGINIFVADATKKKYEKELPGNVTYYHYPEVHYCTKLNDVLKKVNTPYSLLCADDDFIIPNAINACVDFLNENPDYNSAQGHYVLFYQSKNKLFYSPGYLSTVGYDFNEAKASDRIKKFDNVSIQFYYSVHKTNSLKEVFSFADSKLYNLNIVEVLIGLNTLISGKHKVLQLFYSMRETLYGSAGGSAPGLNVFSTLPEYKEQYNAFFSEVVRLLCVKENLSVEEASAILSQSIKDHIEYRYNNKFSLKKLIISLGKKNIPLNIRKRIRHYLLLHRENKRQNANQIFALKINGVPFLNDQEKKELLQIENCILKYSSVNNNKLKS
jgi:glycosyltransferase domain-containing protein